MYQKYQKFGKFACLLGGMMYLVWGCQSAPTFPYDTPWDSEEFDNASFPWKEGEANAKCFGLQLGVTTLSEAKEIFPLENCTQFELERTVKHDSWGKIIAQTIEEKKKSNPKLFVKRAPARH